MLRASFKRPYKVSEFHSQGEEDSAMYEDEMTPDELVEAAKAADDFASYRFQSEEY